MALVNYVSAAAFIVIVVFHVNRLLTGKRLLVGDWAYPGWLSVVEAGIALGLALWLLWSAAR